jgi:formate hydrogenlyase subunit 3/multisubunit Na+/H+ antiporter MnhD subunit
MGLLIGGLALAGFPLTAGFPTHWAVSRVVLNWAHPLITVTQPAAFGVAMTGSGRWIGILALVALGASSIGVIIGLLRGLSAMLGDDPRAALGRQPLLASVLVLALAALATLLGLFPQLFLEPVLEMVRALSGF